MQLIAFDGIFFLHVIKVVRAFNRIKMLVKFENYQKLDPNYCNDCDFGFYWYRKIKSI